MKKFLLEKVEPDHIDYDDALSASELIPVLRSELEVIKRRVRIEHDQDSPNPREDMDWVGTMVSFKGRFHTDEPSSARDEAHEWLRDKAAELDPEIETLGDQLFDMWEDGEEDTPEYQLRVSARNKRVADALTKGVFILELHYREHGPQCCISAGSTWITGADEDDSPDGYIYVTWEKAAEEYGITEWTPETEQRVMTYLQNEVEVYDQWMTGDVYGFICEELREGEDPDCDWTQLDSCWGFYGSDPETNGMKDHWDDEWKADDVEIVYE